MTNPDTITFEYEERKAPKGKKTQFYWYAYKRHDGKLFKAYIGKNKDGEKAYNRLFEKIQAYEQAKLEKQLKFEEV